jgi:hypothetical protein
MTAQRTLPIVANPKIRFTLSREGPLYKNYFKMMCGIAFNTGGARLLLARQQATTSSNAELLCKLEDMTLGLNFVMKLDPDQLWSEGLLLSGFYNGVAKLGIGDFKAAVRIFGVINTDIVVYNPDIVPPAFAEHYEAMLML